MDVNDIVRSGGRLQDYKDAASIEAPVAVADTARAAAIGLQKLQELDGALASMPSVADKVSLLIEVGKQEDTMHAISYAWVHHKAKCLTLLSGWMRTKGLGPQARMFRLLLDAQDRPQSGQDLPPLAELKTPTPPIIQLGPTTWLLDRDGSYLQVEPKHLAVEVERVHGVSCWEEAEDGKRRLMQPAEIYAKAGETARELIWTCGAGQASWDPERRVMKVPAGRYIEGPARHFVAAEKWLERMCGDNIEVVLDWIAGLAHPEMPCPALTVIGPPGCGKSLLGNAVTALFGGFVDYDDIMRQFNEGLRKFPFVWLDERASAHSDTSIFRKIIGGYRHRIEAKFQAVQILEGCVRVLATSNHNDPYRLGEDQLSPTDDEAIGKRILFVPASAAGRHYLEGLGGAEATAGWCDPDGKLTSHLRWVVKNRKVTPGSRFWIEGSAEEYLSRIGSQSSMAGTILDAVVNYLAMSPQEREAQIGEKSPFTWDDKYPNSVIVNAPKLVSVWPLLVGGISYPDVAKVRGNLQRLARGPEKRYPLTDPHKSAPRGFKVSRSSFGERLDAELWPVSGTV